MMGGPSCDASTDMIYQCKENEDVASPKKPKTVDDGNL